MTSIHLFALALSVSVMPLLAHHSVAAQYDMSRKIAILGTITKVEWMNPHPRLWVETATVSSWELELPSPNALNRNTDRNVFRKGDRISAALWQAKDGSMLVCALSLVLADGRAVTLPTGWL